MLTEPAHQDTSARQIAAALAAATHADIVFVGIPDPTMTRVCDIAVTGVPTHIAEAFETGLRGTSLRASPITIAAAHGITAALSRRDPVERHPGQLQTLELVGIEHGLVIPGPANNDGWRLVTALGWKSPSRPLTAEFESTIEDIVHTIASDFGHINGVHAPLA